ncbi:MAG: FHA domain-containing protein, partial [Deltaproteobacteria bacterium]|nr:FHA domain-containing protein [Deltaproteobacteria bacterium]
MPYSIRLNVENDQDNAKSYTIEGSNHLIVGRQQDCAIVLADENVSDYHCLIDISPSSSAIRDLGSLSGTYLNGQPIGQRFRDISNKEFHPTENVTFFLNSGDSIKIGKYKINLEIFDSSYAAKSKRYCELCGESLLDDEEDFCAECQRDPGKILDFLMAKSPNSPYKNIDLLGQGSMGQVWLVENRSDLQKLALRILPANASDEESLRHFRASINMASKLEHPNIVRQFESAHAGGAYKIFMEYCDGGSLLELMKKNGGKLSLALAS